MTQLDFNNDITYTNDFKSSKYKAKLFGKPETDGVNGILPNTKIVALLKYLSNFGNHLKYH